jgi:hypothetical protein
MVLANPRYVRVAWDGAPPVDKVEREVGCGKLECVAFEIVWSESKWIACGCWESCSNNLRCAGGYGHQVSKDSTRYLADRICMLGQVVYMPLGCSILYFIVGMGRESGWTACSECLTFLLLNADLQYWEMAWRFYCRHGWRIRMPSILNPPPMPTIQAISKYCRSALQVVSLFNC